MCPASIKACSIHRLCADWAQKASFKNGGSAPKWIGKVPAPARSAFCLLVAQKQRHLVAKAESKSAMAGVQAIMAKKMKPAAIKAAVEEWPELSEEAKAKFEKAAQGEQNVPHDHHALNQYNSNSFPSPVLPPLVFCIPTSGK